MAIDDEALAAIARGAEGGLRDAESTLDQLIAFCGNKIAEADVLSVFGLVAHDRIAALTDAILDGQTTKSLQVLKDLDDAGKDLQRLAADLLDHFRNLLVMTLGAEGVASLQLPDTEMELLVAQAKRTDSDAVLRIIDALAAAEGRLRYALSKRVFFEIALVKAVKARDMVGIDGLLKKLNELKSGVPVSPRASDVPVARVAPVVPPTRIREAVPANSQASVDEAWAYALEHLGKVTPLAKSYLVGTRPLALRGNVLVVQFDPEFADRKEFANHPRNIEILQASLKEKLRMDIALKFEVGETSSAPAPRAAVAPPAKPGAPTRVIEPAKMNVEDFKNDPLIKKALEIFKGTIVEVRK